MSEKENVEPMNDNEKEFYENMAKAADFVHQRLHDTFVPGGLNDTVPEEDHNAKK